MLFQLFSFKSMGILIFEFKVLCFNLSHKISTTKAMKQVDTQYA